MKALAFVLAALLAVCCAREHFPDEPYAGPPMPEEELPVGGYELLMTQLEYPEGYDWKRDTAYGEVPCKLYLSREGVRVLERDVCFGEGISSDSDMHRIAGGSLFEDYSTETHTIICKDAKELYRWEGRDMLRDIFLKDSVLYMLCSPRGGDGFSLRRNGELIMKNTLGYPTSGLYEDMGHIYFSALTENWPQVYEDGKVRKQSLPEGVIDDYIMVSGQLCVLYHLKSSFSLLANGKVTAFAKKKNESCTYDRILYGGGDIYVEGSHGINGGSRAHAIFRDGKVLYKSPAGFERYASCIDGDHIWTVGSIGESWAVVANGERYDIPQGYSPLSREAMYAKDSSFCLSLVRDGKPSVWRDGEITDYEFNGFIDHFELVHKGR